MFSRSTAQVWTAETSEDRRAGDRSSIRAEPVNDNGTLYGIN